MLDLHHPYLPPLPSPDPTPLNRNCRCSRLPPLRRNLANFCPPTSSYSYHPLPIVFEKALGASVWDPEVRRLPSCSLAPFAISRLHSRVVALCGSSSLTLLPLFFFSGQQVHRLPLGLLCRQPGSLPPSHHRRPHRTGSEAHPQFEGVPHQLARTLLQEAHVRV